MTADGAVDRANPAQPRRHYVLVALLTTAVLLYTVVERIYDANFYVLWEAIAILDGDHPYRDFYVIGWPLQTAVSTFMQWLTGRRLIGEFVIHWSFFIASILMGFHLALRLSRSLAASLTVTLVAILAIASTESFHYPKLFFYPLAVIVGWRYMDHPGVRPAAAAGIVTALAFLFRHDHGVYVGAAFVLAFALARAAGPPSRSAAPTIRDACVYALVAGIIIIPWAVVVHVNEGLPDFIRTRAEWGAVWAPPAGSPYDVLWDIHPLRVLQTSGSSLQPSREQGLIWLVQVTEWLPILVLASVGLELLARWRRGPLMTPDIRATVLVASVSIVAASRLIREESYYVAVLPLSAALGARLMAGRLAGARAWRIVHGTLAAAVLVVTIVAVMGALDWDLLSPNELDELGPTYRQLLTSPAIDAYQSADEARQIDWAAWQTSDADTRQRIMIRYLRDCTRAGDRLLVTGSTPYQVGYFAERPIAGGQLQWHHRWRSDPAHEAQALALLQRQSVPFAFSTHEPVFDDFKAYPRIHAYLKANYVEVEGTRGLLLADRRRQPTGRFGELGFPCFR